MADCGSRNSASLIKASTTSISKPAGTTCDRLDIQLRMVTSICSEVLTASSGRFCLSSLTNHASWIIANRPTPTDLRCRLSIDPITVTPHHKEQNLYLRVRRSAELVLHHLAVCCRLRFLPIVVSSVAANWKSPLGVSDCKHHQLLNESWPATHRVYGCTRPTGSYLQLQTDLIDSPHHCLSQPW